jgi:N-acetylglutamate synthase-like GNAT family acetyltransferase
MEIQYLSWDTDFFGIKIGRIEILDENDFDPFKFKEQALDEKFELIYVSKFGSMLTAGAIYIGHLELVDVMLTMSKKFDEKDYIDTPYEFRRELSMDELDECYNIAEQTSIVSRFYKEPKVGPEKTKELYRKWIDNAINKSVADGLFLVKEANSVAGIHLIKTDDKNKIGFCSVIGVNKSYKGCGLGKKLWEQSFGYWANEKQIEYCKVPFSFLNSESFNFHLKMGFDKIEETKFIYHFRNSFL